jgi:hypothetical protein
LLNRRAIIAGVLSRGAVGRAALIGQDAADKAAFPGNAYVMLEPLDTRDFARTYPRGFLSQHRNGAIIDEVQRASDLLSYLQDKVDRDPTRETNPVWSYPSVYVRTFSAQLIMSEM